MYGEDRFLRTEPIPGEDGITSAQRVKIWHVITQNGISKQAFINVLHDKFQVANAKIMTKREAMKLITQLSWIKPPIKADTSWAGPCPRYEQKGGEQ